MLLKKEADRTLLRSGDMVYTTHRVKAIRFEMLLNKEADRTLLHSPPSNNTQAHLYSRENVKLKQESI